MPTPPHAASINVRMTLQLRERLDAVAYRHGVDVSQVARLAISEGLEAADRVIGEAIDEAGEESIANALRARAAADDPR